MNDKNRKIAIIIAAILGCVGLFYLGGMLGQLLGNRSEERGWTAAAFPAKAR